MDELYFQDGVVVHTDENRYEIRSLPASHRQLQIKAVTRRNTATPATEIRLNRFATFCQTGMRKGKGR